MCSDRTLHPGVTESHILPLEGPFSAILTPDSWRKKGQTFPPVLHLLETLIKHSERKNRKGKKSHNLSFFCFCCLEGSRKNLVPEEASNTQGQYWATQNSLPKLLTWNTHVLGSVETQKLFRVADQRSNRDRSHSLLKPSPTTEMNLFRAKQVQVLVYGPFSAPATPDQHSLT